MKKIRFLAALLVLLMLPLSVLVGCNNNPDDKEPEDPVEDPAGNNGNTGGNSGGNTDVSDTPADNDGLSGNGYLVMFNFNVAKRGNLPTVAPYSRYLKATTGLKNTSYIIDDEGGKNGSGALLIQRKGGAAKSAVVFTASALGGTFGSQHTLEFDIKLGNGLFGDKLEITAGDGSASSAAKLLTVTTDGKLLDCDGTTLYEIKSSYATEWVHVALAVDDRASTYSAYINGVRKINESSFSSKSIEVSQYAFALSGSTTKDVYCYLDNMAFVDGLEPKEYTSDDVIYKDQYTYAYDIFTASTTDDDGNVFPNIDALLAAYKSTGLDTKVESTPYKVFKSESEIAKSMSNMLTLIKVDGDGNVIDEPFNDYGVLAGLYDYGAPVGGKLYTYTGDETQRYIDFNSDKKLTFSAKNIGSTAGEVTGTYEVSGSEEEPWIKLTYGTNKENVIYCKLNVSDGKLYTYADENFTTCTSENGYHVVSAPFNKVEYSYKKDDVEIAVKVNNYTGKAYLLMKDGGTSVDTSEATFNYDEMTNVLTVTVGEDSYMFTYVPEVVATETDPAVPAYFTYGTGEIKLTKTEEKEYISAEDAEAGYQYVLRYQNFSTGSTQVVFKPDTTNFNASLWKRIKFDYYVTPEMYNDRFQFLVYIYTGQNEGGMSYYSKSITCGSGINEGWNSFDLDITSLGLSRTPDLARFESVVLTTTGWSNGPAGKDHDTAYDGYSIYVKNVQFVTDTSVAVKGPDKGKDDCTHMDEDGNSLFVSTGERKDPTCSSIGYAVLKCSECNAEKIDKTKSINSPIGHDFTDAEVFTVDATCTDNGYTYHCCKTCNEAVNISVIAATGHEMVTKNITGTKLYVSTCSTCGYEETMQLSDSLMSMSEKVSSSSLATNEYFYIDEKTNKDLSHGSYEVDAAQQVYGCVNIQCKFTKATAVQLDNGKWALKMQRKSGTSLDSYIDYSLSKRYGLGGNFVCEFDVMLGGKNSAGKYEKFAGNLIERDTKNGSPTNIHLFDVSDTGILTFDADKSATIELSPYKFTNIAMVFKTTENALEVYVDGCKQYTMKLSTADNGADYVTSVSWSELRVTFVNGATAAEGQCHYFNNFATYAAEYPICILGLGNTGGGDTGSSSTEFEGTDIDLKDKDGNVVTEPINVVADTVLSLPKGVNTSKYVLEFKLSAEDALADGTLLTGHKEDKYHMMNDLELLTVKNGWLYLNGVAIADLTDIADGIKIKMEFNEFDGEATVYVNDVEVPGGAIKYPAAKDVSDLYADEASRIRSYTFGSEVGAYTISDIDMYANK